MPRGALLGTGCNSKNFPSDDAKSWPNVAYMCLWGIRLIAMGSLATDTELVHRIVCSITTLTCVL